MGEHSLRTVKGKILVSGGAGYIGSHTVLALREAGYEVVVVDNLSTGQRALVPADVPLIVGDIADQNLVSQVLQDHACMAVFHFAGSILVPESVTNPLKYYANNTAASRDLIECCIAQGVGALVFSSTAAVYGNLRESPVSEEAETNPINPYGSSKLMTEWMLRDVSAMSNFRYAALRYFNVAGADPQGRSGQIMANTSHLIRVACEVATGTRSEMSIFGEDYDTPDGTCIRDYVHVSDLAFAHVLTLRHLLEKRENLTLNCGYGHGFSVREVLDVVEDLADRPMVIKSAGRRDGDASIVVSDSRKIRNVLNWSPKFDDLRGIVKSTLDWESSLSTQKWFKAEIQSAKPHEDTNPPIDLADL